MSEIKHVIIQKRIDEAIDEEINEFFQSTEDDPLMRLVIQGKIGQMSLDEIKKELGVENGVS